MDVGALLKVKRRVAIVHDYNLPFGPWGQEQTPEQLKELSGGCYAWTWHVSKVGLKKVAVRQR